MQKSQINLVFNEAEKALDALKVALDAPMQESKISVDATIRRFKLSIELFLKLLKRILATKGVEAQYPKDVLRQAYAGKLINNEEQWLAMLADRNLTSHTYNEDLAMEIYLRIQKHYPTLKATFDTLKKNSIRRF